MSWDKGSGSIQRLVEAGELERVTASVEQAEAMLDAKGGHIVLFDAAMAQFDPPLGKLIRPFNRMRTRRNQVEYASSENPQVTTEEVLGDAEKAQALIDLAEQVLPQVDEF